MSTSNNPQYIGVLHKGLENQITIPGSKLGKTNLQDVYLFELSDSGNLSLSTGGFDLIVGLGRDTNNNGIYEANEIIGEVNLGNSKDEITIELPKGNYFVEFRDDLNGEDAISALDRDGAYYSSRLSLDADIISNPTNLGFLENGTSQEIKGSSANIDNVTQYGTNILQAGYSFKLPTSGVVTIDKRTVDTDTILARDSNNDGMYDSTIDETIAFTEYENTNGGFGARIEDITISEQLDAGNYLLVFEDGRNLTSGKEVPSAYNATITFNAAENTAANSTNPALDPIAPIFSVNEELSNSDLSYLIEGNQEPFYYDSYTVSAEFLAPLVGQTISMEVQSADFEPFVFLLNADTFEIIDDSYNSLGSGNAQIDVKIQPDVNYLVSVESALPGETGSYTFAGNSI
ncbi:hypothetical protein Riv7116_5131 [Rivularia sp. PCC 7116]|uniref:hypothetical protein n=1 Tax=Rivularia sp. PCC 7116 TaxID=373994 RepID=UPI00029F0A32|nr:hypothetical protein [Rivularia sp. PCC 7116]AFY57528.1 hypothetical protein Riv7116_5131 [Rivularia sp. PCC 7116]